MPPSYNTPVHITYLGETKSVKAWAKDPRCEISEGCLRKRLRLGWDFEKAFCSNKDDREKTGRKPNELFTFQGESKSVTEWSRDNRCLVCLTTLFARIYRSNWDFEKALTTPSCINTTEIPIAIGQKFGKLTVLGKGGRDTKGVQKWICLCECGKESSCKSWHLRSGSTTSCGCVLKIRIAEAGKQYRLNHYSDFPCGFQEVFSTYKTGAKKRNLEFCLSKDEFYLLSQQNCFYCNCKPNNKKTRENDFIYNGIDRKDNNLGYTLENSLPCCKICNVAKNHLDYNIFLKHIENIYLNLKNKNKI